MNLKPLLTVSALVSAMASSFVWADEPAAAAFTPEQKTAIQSIVHDYLLNQPEVLIEASQVLQKKQQESQQNEAKGSILKNAKQLITESLSVAGNPKGNVTVVEFFDYQCGHCKQMKTVLNKLMQAKPNVRVVYKEFPIFGQTSEDAARVALAAAMQGKYEQVHNALLSTEKHLDKNAALAIAQSVGANMTKLKLDMQSKTVSDALVANRKLAEQLHLMGTPAFIVMATPNGQFKDDSQPSFIPGATTEANLQSLVTKAEG